MEVGVISQGEQTLPPASRVTVATLPPALWPAHPRLSEQEIVRVSGMMKIRASLQLPSILCFGLFLAGVRPGGRGKQEVTPGAAELGGLESCPPPHPRPQGACLVRRTHLGQGKEISLS